MEKLEMQTKNLTQEKIKILSGFFPNAVVETIRDGKTELSFDFECLKEDLSDFISNDTFERYQFSWPNKRKMKIMANQETNKTLRPNLKDSINFDKTNNIFIEGDNLEALKILRETYLGKIKMIYIDPPYNTGGDFIYSDDFSMGVKDFQIENNEIDDDGNRLFVNSNNDGRFHTNWLNMIYPRLILARDFLRDDGVIFINIDDKEAANLTQICNEIFGERNFVSDLIWQSRTSISSDFEISMNHNHTLIYSKSRPSLKFGGNELDVSDYENPDNDPRGPYILVPIDANHNGGDTYFPIRNPNTGVDYYPPNGRCWSYNPATVKKLMEDGRIKFGKTDKSAPKRKLFLNERIEKGDVKTPSSLLLDVGTTKDGTEELMDIFDGLKVFDYPKPVSLLERLIQFGVIEKKDIVMDFFAGSGTTANAIFEFNKKHESDLSWILIQLPFDLDWAYEHADLKAKPTIKRSIELLDSLNKPHLLSELTKERIRRCSIRYDTNVGYRAFKIDSSNMKDVFYTPDTTFKLGLDSLLNNIKDDRTSLDLLFQVMLELGIELSTTITEEKINGKSIFSVDNDYLVACFDDTIDEEIILSIAKREFSPTYAIFRDCSFKNDNTISNLEQIFKTYSPTTNIRIL